MSDIGEKNYLMNNVAQESSVQSVITQVNDVVTKTSSVATDAASAKSNTATNNTASSTGTLSQKNSYIISQLENNTYGLNALKNTIGHSGRNIPISFVVKDFPDLPANSTTSIGTWNGKGTARIIFSTGYHNYVSDFTITIDGTNIVSGPLSQLHSSHSSVIDTTFDFNSSISIKATMGNLSTTDLDGRIQITFFN